ncbi:MAG: hypothetical protein WCG67_08300 [Ferruginibacter sp.]
MKRKYAILLILIFSSIELGFSNNNLYAAEEKKTSDETRKPNDGLELILNSGDIYYSKYNLVMTDKEINNTKREGYYISSIPLQFRYNYYLNIKKDIFIAPYLNYFGYKYDLGTNEWNNAYWNNNQTTAVGAQLGRAEEFRENYKNNINYYMGGLYCTIFIEKQFINSSMDRTKDVIPASVPSDNIKTGVNTWYANKKLVGNNKYRLWTEVWGEFAYQTTNFYANNNSDYLIVNIAPKAGLSIDVINNVALEPYFRVNYKKDVLSKKCNDYPWNNFKQCGTGVRVALNRILPLPGEPYLYSEYLIVTHLSQTKQELSHDIKIGLNYWVKIL